MGRRGDCPSERCTASIQECLQFDRDELTPAELAVKIRKHVPIFSIDYHVDPVRQSIADTWPHSLDASVARQDWNFSPWYDLAAMMADMREPLGARINARKIGA